MNLPIEIKAFRASDNIELSKEFVKGHLDVLKSYGFTGVSSAEEHWIKNPNCIVITARSQLNFELIGGIRLQQYSKSFGLPFIDALIDKDENINGYINNFEGKNFGEICGLWNSKKVKGLGISVYLMRSVIVLLEQLNVDVLLGLCSPFTKNSLLSMGFVIERSLGDNGEFFYPNEDLIATSIILDDPLELKSAKPSIKKWIYLMRESLTHVRTENCVKLSSNVSDDTSNKGKLDFTFNFKLENNDNLY